MKSCLKSSPLQPPSSTTGTKIVDFEPLVSVKIISFSDEELQQQREQDGDKCDHDKSGEVDAFAPSLLLAQGDDTEISGSLWYTHIEYLRIKRRNKRCVRKMKQPTQRHQRQHHQQANFRVGSCYYSRVGAEEEDDDVFRGLERHIDMARKTRIYRSIHSVLQEQDRLFMKRLISPRTHQRHDYGNGNGEGSRPSTTHNSTSSSSIAEIYSGFCLPSLKKAIELGRQDRLDADAIYNNCHTATATESDDSDSVSSSFMETDSETESDESDEETEASAASATNGGRSDTMTPPVDSIRVAKTQSLRQSHQSATAMTNKKTGGIGGFGNVAATAATMTASSKTSSSSSHEMFFLGETIINALLTSVVKKGAAQISDVVVGVKVHA